MTVYVTVELRLGDALTPAIAARMQRAGLLAEDAGDRVRLRWPISRPTYPDEIRYEIWAACHDRRIDLPPSFTDRDMAVLPAPATHA